MISSVNKTVNLKTDINPNGVRIAKPCLVREERANLTAVVYL